MQGSSVRVLTSGILVICATLRDTTVVISTRNIPQKIQQFNFHGQHHVGLLLDPVGSTVHYVLWIHCLF